MFPIRQEQLDALQARSHAETRQRLLTRLEEQRIAFSLDKSGDILIPDNRGHASRVSFGSNGLIQEIRKPSGDAYRYTHDKQGRVVQTELPGGDRWRREFNQQGLMSSFEVVGHARYQFQYDGQGRLSGITHPDERTETFVRDPAGQVIQHTSRSGAVSRLGNGPDASRRIDALGRETRYELDTAGELDRVQFPDGTSESYSADSAAGVIQVTQRSGRSVSCRLAEGQPVQLRWEDGSQLELQQDDAGRVVAAVNATDEIKIAYNDQGLVAQEVSGAGALAYEYDADGHLIALTTHHGDTIRYQYDQDGRLVAVHDWDGRRISYEHAANGLPSRIVYPNGVLEAWQSRGQPARLEVTLGDADGRYFSAQVLQYNSCDRLVGIVDQWGRGLLEQRGRRLEYDPEFRLVAEVDTATGHGSAQYVYDAVGNMVRDGAEPIAFGPMDNPQNHGGQPLAYDALGNLTSFVGQRGAVRLAYSDDSQLASAHVRGKTWHYAYDGLCRRVRKTDGRASWTYGWGGAQLLWEEYRSTPEAEPVRRDYLYLPNCVVPIAFREAGETYWIQSDYRGAVVAVHDRRGQLVWRGVYDGFGQVDVVINKVRQPWRLSGQYFDDESGLHYNLVRYYSPELKTYLSLDPRWQEPGGTKYSYCVNDPWNRADPTGGIAPLVLGAIAVGAAGLISGAVAAYNAPEGEGWSAFGKGFVVGAGATLVGLGAAALLGPAATAVAGLAAIGAVEGAASSVLDDLVNGRPICLECMVMSAGLGAVLGIVIPGVGGFLGRTVLKKLGPKLKPLIDKLLKRGKTKPKALPKPPKEDLSQGGEFLDDGGFGKQPPPPPKPPIGHAKPWSEMTKAEKQAFQHSYSRHAQELGLPNWSGKNAESLRQQFNNAAGHIRENAQKQVLTKKPYGVKGSGESGGSVDVRFFEYTDPGGTKFYYYETLDGKFISAGKAR